MKTPLVALLWPLLLAARVVAATLPVELGGLRPVAPAFVDIKFRLEPGPAAKEPVAPPHLSPAHIIALTRFLRDSRNSPRGPSDALLQRLVSVLENVDMHYKRPIGPAEWDQRIQEMQDEFVRRHGPPGSARKTEPQWEEAVDGMIAGFVKRLGDPHTMYFNREQAQTYDELVEGKFVGIGAGVDADPDGVKVVLVYPDSPAARAGLLRGDVIIAVDGVPTKGEEVKSVIGRIRGPVGTPVKIRVTRLPQPLTITRAAVEIPYLVARMAAPEIGYVYYGNFEPGSDVALFAAIDKLRALGAKKLILDLRDNTGGEIDMAYSIASEFLQDKDLIASVKRQGQIAHKAITLGPGRFAGMPLAILINDGSASASELVSAALQEHDRGKNVGSPSYGKGSAQLPLWTEIPLVLPRSGVVGWREDGTMVTVTDGGWYTPNDRNVAGVFDAKLQRNIPGSGGVKPDELVVVSEAVEKAVMAGIDAQLFKSGGPAALDPVLEKAIAVLNLSK